MIGMSKDSYKVMVVVLSVALAILVSALVSGVLFISSNKSPGRQEDVGSTVTIGGPFVLRDHRGQSFTEQDLKGGYSLIYFGYSFCPDVCPTSLAVIAQALSKLEEENPKAATQVTPIFITLDPERDGPEEIASYISHFHPRMVGLTGSVKQVRLAAEAYRVFFQKTTSEESSDYLIDHSSIIYLMGPDGQFIRHFVHATSPDVIAEELLALLKS